MFRVVAAYGGRLSQRQGARLDDMQAILGIAFPAPLPRRPRTRAPSCRSAARRRNLRKRKAQAREGKAEAPPALTGAVTASPSARPPLSAPRYRRATASRRFPCAENRCAPARIADRRAHLRRSEPLAPVEPLAADAARRIPSAGSPAMVTKNHAAGAVADCQRHSGVVTVKSSTLCYFATTARTGIGMLQV